MKKGASFFCFLILAFMVLGLIVGCPNVNDGTDSTTTTTIDNRLALTGSMNLGSGNDAKPGLFKAVFSDKSVTRAATNEYYAIDESQSHIICDDFTFKLSGEYNKTTKQFNASSRGKLPGNIEMVFSITCTYNSDTGDVSGGSAGLSVTVGGGTPTVFTGPLVAKGTQASKTGEVKHYAGYFYSINTNISTTYKEALFEESAFNAAKTANLPMGWGQLTFTIDANNRVTGTSWSKSAGVSGRWYLKDDGTLFDGSKFIFRYVEPVDGLTQYDGEGNLIPFDYTGTDYTMKLRDGIFSGVCKIKEDMYFAYKLEPVVASKKPEPDAVTKLPFEGDWIVKQPGVTGFVSKLHMTNESFADVFIYDEPNKPSDQVHGIVVEAEVADNKTTAIIKFTKDTMKAPGTNGMEGIILKMVVTKINDNKYEWIQSASMTKTITWDPYDYTAVKALNFDALPSGFSKTDLMGGTFEK